MKSYKDLPGVVASTPVGLLDNNLVLGSVHKK